MTMCPGTGTYLTLVVQTSVSFEALVCTSRKKVNFYFVNFPKFVRHSSQLIAQNHAREVTRSELNFYSRTTKRVPGEQEKGSLSG